MAQWAPPPGDNQIQWWTDPRYGSAGWLSEFMKNNYGLLNDQLSYAQGLEPTFQRLINQYLANNDPGRMDADINRAANQNLGMAGQNALSSDAMLRSLGIGSGARGGNVAANYNQAAQQTNQYANYLRSPEGQSDRLQGSLAAVGQGQNLRALPAQMQATAGWSDVWKGLLQQDRDNASQGGFFGNLLGTLAGGAAQGLTGGLFKGAQPAGGKTASPNASLNQAFPTSQANGMQPAGQYGFGQQDMARALGQGRWAW